MIAGRLHWKPAGAKLPGKVGLAAFDFPGGTLTLTEAGTKRRAALHAFAGRAGLAGLDRGGIEPLEATPDAFREALLRENHTLKRALTDPRLLAGIGGAYSDEILHRARLSPMQWTSHLDDGEVERLRLAVREVLEGWTDRLRREAGGAFPEGVTAFRDGMAVHGRHRQPCPVCATPVQRIVHAENETDYCPRCQTGGRILSDRSLARLLKDDWPRTVEEMEALEGRRRQDAKGPGPGKGTP
jgi:formamidopyrimidine-DNA glycosylase